MNSNYSIEGFYHNIRCVLKDKINIDVVTCPYESNGIFRRLYNAGYCFFRQGDVNHITGDVNYLNMFLSREKNIVTILDCGLIENTHGMLSKIYKYFWYTLPVSKARYIVAISQATKDEILKHVHCSPDKIKVIHVSVSPMYYRSEKVFNKSKPVILQIGTAPNKNIARLAAALKEIDCELRIIGMLHDADKTALIENNINYINFAGLSDEEVLEQYKICDILSFVSTYEGFGMPIVEANTVGRAVITGNILSMPEVAGDSALKVDPYNINEIRDGILKIINDDEYRNELIRCGYINAEKFRISNIADQYLELYNSMWNHN